MVAVPRLVIAAPASGAGKTTVACGLMAALRASGLAVSGHKAGPDYIDPGYHAMATGRAARNLDPFLCGEQRIAPLFRHGARGAEVAVIEGVMGLFDGTQPPSGEGAGDPGFGSTAHVARLLGAPVVLVIDAASAGRSVAAVATGFARFDSRTTVAGVIFNRVASDRHERLLRDSLAAAGIPVYGAIRRSAGVSAPSRHLGLIPAAERAVAAAETMDRLAALVTASCDLGGLVGLARSAPLLSAVPWDPAEALADAPGSPSAIPGVQAAGADARAARPLVAMAGGAAFTFSYTEHAELLAAAGLEVAVFDPVCDERLPEGTAGLVLGGGFPEVHAAELSANEPLRRDVAAAAGRGMPVVAECAGLLYLSRTLDGRPMCGVLPVDATMTSRLTLGYREARAESDSVVAAAGDVVRAHEFHRTDATPAHGERAAWQLPSGDVPGDVRARELPPGEDRGHGRRREGHVAGPVHGSYLHTHWAGYPQAAARLAAACATPAARRAPGAAPVTSGSRS
jgi:cobyrinic acid a,c-diamide synthase